MKTRWSWILINGGGARGSSVSLSTILREMKWLVCLIGLMLARDVRCSSVWMLPVRVGPKCGWEQWQLYGLHRERKHKKSDKSFEAVKRWWWWCIAVRCVWCVKKISDGCIFYSTTPATVYTYTFFRRYSLDKFAIYVCHEFLDTCSSCMSFSKSLSVWVG